MSHFEKMKVHTAVFNMNNQQGPVYSAAENSAPDYVAAWTEEHLGENGYAVYVELSHLTVYLKPSQCC